MDLRTVLGLLFLFLFILRLFGISRQQIDRRFQKGPSILTFLLNAQVPKVRNQLGHRIDVRRRIGKKGRQVVGLEQPKVDGPHF